MLTAGARRNVEIQTFSSNITYTFHFTLYSYTLGNVNENIKPTHPFDKSVAPSYMSNSAAACRSAAATTRRFSITIFAS